MIPLSDTKLICDKSKFTKNNYTGVPNIIVEITSPFNTTHDTLLKLLIQYRR